MQLLSHSMIVASIQNSKSPPKLRLINPCSHTFAHVNIYTRLITVPYLPVFKFQMEQHLKLILLNSRLLNFMIIQENLTNPQWLDFVSAPGFLQKDCMRVSMIIIFQQFLLPAWSGNTLQDSLLLEEIRTYIVSGRMKRM